MNIKQTETMTKKELTKQLESSRELGVELLETVSKLRVNTFNLRNQLDSRNREMRRLKRELMCYKSLAAHGKIYVKYFSQDCDGVCSQKNLAFLSYEELCKQEESEAEWTDGSFDYHVVNDESELWLDNETGTFGHGWDIN